MKDEWIKAANAMGGIVHFGCLWWLLLCLGAIDSTVEEGLAREYGIQGFPTIKIFSPLNKNPTDYQNARQAKPFCKAAFAVCFLSDRWF